MITVSNISKNYKDKQVLNNISYNFEDKGLYFILGKSGSGKTTLLNIISGNIEPSTGNIIYSNINSIYLDSYYIYQDFNLVPSLTVLENIKLVLKIKKKTYDESLVLDKLKSVGLEELKDSKTKKLSGGERQRLSIVIGLILESKVIFLDEPTSALDYQNRDSIISYLRELSTNTLVIIATHDLNLINENDNVIDLNNFESKQINELSENTKPKKINLGFDAFYIKNKMMKKDTFRLFFQILFITLLLVSLSLIIPFSNMTYESVCAKEIINGSQNILIPQIEDKSFISSYCLNEPVDSSITINYENKDVRATSVFIDNSLNDDEVILSSVTANKLSSESIENKFIYLNSNLIKVLKVENFDDISHSLANPAYEYIKLNYNTYVKVDLAYTTVDLYIAEEENPTYVYYFDVNSSLEPGTFTVTQKYYDKFLKNYNIGETIQLKTYGTYQNEFVINLKLADIGEKNTIDKVSLYKLQNDSNHPYSSVIISNLNDYNQTKTLVKYLKDNRVNYFFNNENSAYFVAQVFDGLDILLKVLIPILLIFSIFLTIYISYNMYKNNKRSFNVLSLLGVSKQSILFICLIDHIECILISIVLSIYPCIAISNEFMNQLNNMNEYHNLNVSFTLFEPQYLCVFALLIFIVLFAISLIFNLIRNTKSTYINE